MTTAIRPTNGTWEEVFADIDDNDPVVEVINSVKYVMAAIGRFGIERPTASGLTEKMVLAQFRTWMENDSFKTINPSIVNRYIAEHPEMDDTVKDAMEFGLLMTILIRLGHAKPQVGQGAN